MDIPSEGLVEVRAFGEVWAAVPYRGGKWVAVRGEKAILLVRHTVRRRAEGGVTIQKRLDTKAQGVIGWAQYGRCEMTTERYICCDCESPEVEVEMWVHANTEELCGDVRDGGACWCRNCQEHTGLSIVGAKGPTQGERQSCDNAINQKAAQALLKAAHQAQGTLRGIMDLDEAMDFLCREDVFGEYWREGTEVIECELRAAIDAAEEEMDTIWHSHPNDSFHIQCCLQCNAGEVKG